MGQLYEPMLLTPTASLPEGDDWIFEPKLNGYRALGYISTTRTVLRSRRGNSFNDQFPGVVQQLPAALSGHTAVVDGEVVGFDQEGWHDLQTIRRRTSRMVYYLFDLLELDDEPLIRQPWQDRHQLLARTLSPQHAVELCPQYSANDRDSLLIAAQKLALEGIVAKRVTSRYLPGRRSKDWRKLKFKI